MQKGKGRIVVHLTVDTSGEKSNYLLATPNITSVVE